MIPKKKLLPIRRRAERTEKSEEDNKNLDYDEKMMNEALEKERGELHNQFGGSNSPMGIPDFLLRSENEQYLQLFIRMRQRHLADGAVSINVEQDDIADQNLELYDNKGINIEPPIINENLANHVEYFVESANRDQFFKIPKALVEKETEREKSKQEEKLKKISKKGITDTEEGDIKKQEKLADLGRTTQDQMFLEFDLKLTEIINQTSNKVSLIFLFAQGLLAGISLVNILLLFQYMNFNSFIMIYSFNVREIFNFTHAFTFVSLTGNGIKFISAYKRCKKYG
jgi:hypothetical protein